MLLSIITINYNDREGLAKTMQSVAMQTRQDFEYIVIDGGSTDGGEKLLNDPPRKLDYSVSEPDKGIYNAMNKGIAAAHGDYLLFLNSGDYFYREDVIEKVLDRIEQGDNKDFYCGNVKFEEKEKFQYAPKNVTAFYLVGNSIPHQACFIRRSLLVKRPYLETYRIVSDWEQMLYACLYEHASFEYMDIVVSVFNLGGISNNKKMQRVRGEEMADVVNKLIPSLVEAFQRPLTPADWKYYHAMHYGSRTKRNWKIMRNAFKDLIRHWTGR